MAITGISEVFTISKGDVSAVVDAHGAKVLSICVGGREILFYDEKDIAHSGIPLCFPSFGPLKESAFIVDGISYPMNQHGFIRDSLFAVTKPEESALVCRFSSNEETLKRYPFVFDFTVYCEITDNGLSMRFLAENKNSGDLPLSPGVHPYFAVSDSTAVTITSGAHFGNDNSAGYAEKSVEDSGVFEVIQALPNGLRELKIVGSPDIHLTNHNLDTTIISTGHPQGVLMTAESSVFNRMTVWRKNETAPYICVEPACVQNGLNSDPILVPAGEAFDTVVTIELNR